MSELPPRLLPDEPLPPYSYVSGFHPHPNRDPAGHSYGEEPTGIEAPTSTDWRTCRAYLYGIDLFNYGFYWEAHEAWESVWLAAGRRGPMADFLKGLIKLAAAGVKGREGRPDGVLRHARRAQQLFEQVAAADTRESDQYLGQDIGELTRLAERLSEAPPERFAAPDPKREIDVLLQVQLHS
jgi:hypothetical protein